MKTDVAIDRAHPPATPPARQPDPQPLHVLIVNSVLTGGGVDSQTLSQCQALLGEGARVTLAISARSPWVARARAITGLHLLVLDTPRWQWPLSLARLVQREGVQVIHAHHGRDYWVAILAHWLSLQHGLVVVTRHLMTAMKAKTRRYLAPNADVVAVSDAVAARLRAGDPKGSLRLRRIYCGIDTQLFRPDDSGAGAMRASLGLPPDAWVFAVVGAIHAPDGKGQFHFARAAQQVLARHPDAYFVCAGWGEAVPELLAEARALGLGDHFLHRPFGDDMAALMQSIDVLVHPAVASEALGLVILEALSCGKPVIASRLDGIPETLAEGVNGLLVPPRDVDSLAQAMNRLADDRALARRMGAQGRDWVVSRFSLACVGQQTLALYREGLAERS